MSQRWRERREREFGEGDKVAFIIVLHIIQAIEIMKK